MVEWLAGNRIIGTTAERPLASLQSPSVGGWVELGRTTLGSAGDSIDVTGLADKRYYMVLGSTLNGSGGGTQQSLQFNGDGANNYGRRYSADGGGDTANQATRISTGASTAANQLGFTVGYVANKSDKEKLAISHGVDTKGTGVGTAPSRYEAVGKWANATDPIDQITIFNPTSGDFQSNSQCVILGWDPADTHTDNFWEELASVDLSGGAADTISSGVFTSKKYLWVQAYTGNTGGATRASLRVGNTTIDIGSNYAYRSSINGAGDGIFTSADRMSASSGAVADKEFHNYFIINNSANEKLMTGNAVRANTAGAGNAPTRHEFAGKWVNISNQIDIVQMFNDQAGDFGTETIMKVWGSD